MPDTQPKPFVFVLMPFDKKFDDIYKLGIKATCDEAGAYCERVNEQLFDESILERVYNQISKADLLIADMTGRNPNVFYEVGYAHALGRRVILLTKRSKDIPFDLKHYPHIIYGGSITGLKAELLAKVKWAIGNPKGKVHKVEPALEFRINHQAVNANPEFSVTNDSTPFRGVPIEMHNSVQKAIEPIEFKVGILMPRSWSAKFATSRIVHEEENFDLPWSSFIVEPSKILYVVSKPFDLLPGEWKRFYAFFSHGGPRLTQCSIRAFLKTGAIDFPFRLLPDEKQKAS